MSYPSLPKHGDDAPTTDWARQKVAAPAVCLMILGACGVVVGIVLAADKGLPRSHEALQVASLRQLKEVEV